MKRKTKLDLPKEVLKEAEEIIADLNDKQKAFCREYVRDWNGRRSYHAAYPNNTNETADVNASKLLSNTKVQEYIKYLRDNLEEACGISKLRIVEELMVLALTDTTEMYDSWITRKELSELTPALRACIQEVSTSTRKVFDQSKKKDIEVEFVKIKFYSRIEAMKEIKKTLGYDAAEKFETKLNLSGTIKISYK